mmetsp:Transcript_16003/g.36615  ORF Transcript_16003/g.36615 Transcript_16003/m.36615 type:complete len:310 (-) Transcript_16003:1061-1990(-)
MSLLSSLASTADFDLLRILWSCAVSRSNLAFSTIRAGLSGELILFRILSSTCSRPSSFSTISSGVDSSSCRVCCAACGAESRVSLCASSTSSKWDLRLSLDGARLLLERWESTSLRTCDFIIASILASENSFPSSASRLAPLCLINFITREVIVFSMSLLVRVRPLSSSSISRSYFSFISRRLSLSVAFFVSIAAATSFSRPCSRSSSPRDAWFWRLRSLVCFSSSSISAISRFSASFSFAAAIVRCSIFASNLLFSVLAFRSRWRSSVISLATALRSTVSSSSVCLSLSTFLTSLAMALSSSTLVLES